MGKPRPDMKGKPARRRLDLTGQRYGRLTVIQISEKTEIGKVVWQCKCDCGNDAIASTAALRIGWTKSCGCLMKEAGNRTRTHGLTDTSTYNIWDSMRQRCQNPNRKDYPKYGGRGIKVCERWQVFENFLADMGERPAGLTLDRKDVNGNYEPGNCRWATTAEQASNRTDSRLVSFRGETKCIADWAREVGISKVTLRCRLDAGWDVDLALTKPIDKRYSTQKPKQR